jgi:hypothetical protein
MIGNALKNPGATLSPLQLRFLNASQRSQVIRAAASRKLDPNLARGFILRQAGELYTLRANGLSISATVTFAGRGAEKAIRRAIESGKVASGDVRKFWRTRHDERVRVSHAATETMNATGRAVDEPFQTPLGPVNAPPLEINCRCTVIWQRTIRN